MFLDIHGGCSPPPPPCISVAAVGSKPFFVIFARIVVVSFFRPSSSIFNRHFLFIFLCLNTGEGDSVFICFPSFGTSSIYIYIQIPHQTRHKSIKNYIIVWVRVVAVERTPVIGIIIQSVFFSAFCTIYNRFSSRSAGGFLTLPSHFPAIMLCTPIDCTSSVLVTQQQNTRKKKKITINFTPSRNS
ncbi:hypothetical protein DAPPUDRAFT_306939 [Daphnia pulex]|uniref:Uncharacterized protein n=1 Tax=Daphnia pulex TaxID=6669 RepID=E9H062_DAPPU|nr:hypothetical protein DAPPUDRAFT_306939 [Daphnia pulex]|eukprot:EFX74936.1 hypothetical protein DAPPUDRAFT_306939 [Daphnia pulex]